MVSILSFSPFTLLPFFGINHLKDKTKKSILIFISIWILLWSISIPYTRVAMASSISLVIFGFSQPVNFKNNIYLDISRSTIFLLGLIYTLLFSFWSLSYLPDLPLASLVNKKVYSRTTLSRDYIKKHNIILNKDSEKHLVPSREFELAWQKIEMGNPDRLLFLKGAPKRFGYFMNKGLITSKKIKISKELKNKSYCFELDPKQIINKSSC